jgi:hypothetical protein
MIFRSNKACAPASGNNTNPSVSPSAYDTTCIYRSDLVGPTDRGTAYRQDRTESFLDGILYEINFGLLHLLFMFYHRLTSIL